MIRSRNAQIQENNIYFSTKSSYIAQLEETVRVHTKEHTTTVNDNEYYLKKSNEQMQSIQNHIEESYKELDCIDRQRNVFSGHLKIQGHTLKECLDQFKTLKTSLQENNSMCRYIVSILKSK